MTIKPPTYIAVFVALLILLGVTVAVAYVNLGPLNVGVAMAIAIVKALLIVLFFMHVRYDTRLVKIFVAASTLWLVILLAGTVGDFVTRSARPTPMTDALRGVPLHDSGERVSE